LSLISNGLLTFYKCFNFVAISKAYDVMLKVVIKRPSKVMLSLETVDEKK